MSSESWKPGDVVVAVDTHALNTNGSLSLVEVLRIPLHVPEVKTVEQDSGMKAHSVVEGYTNCRHIPNLGPGMVWPRHLVLDRVRDDVILMVFQRYFRTL